MAQPPIEYQRLAASFFLMLLFSLLARGQEVARIVEPGTASDAPVSSEALSQRIEDAAVKYRANAPIPRIIFYEIAYPSSAQEYTEMGGHALLLVTAFSQQQAELPLKRAYIRLGGKESELKLITSVISQRPRDGSQIVATFGQYRADSLYLLPARLRLESAELLVDFTKNRDGFKLPMFPDPTGGSYSLADVPPEKMPSEEALAQFVRREYPGFTRD